MLKIFRLHSLPYTVNDKSLAGLNFCKLARHHFSGRRFGEFTNNHNWTILMCKNFMWAKVSLSYSTLVAKNIHYFLWWIFSLTEAAVLCGILCPPQRSGIYHSKYKNLAGSGTSELYVGLFKVSTTSNKQICLYQFVDK